MRVARARRAIFLFGAAGGVWLLDLCMFGLDLAVTALS
jgi:hypothetical protein